MSMKIGQFLLECWQGKVGEKCMGKAMLVPHDALATETSHLRCYLETHHLKKALVNPGSTLTLVSEDFVSRNSIPMRKGSCICIELANEQIEVLVGALIEPQEIDIGGITTILNLPVVQ